VVSFTLQPVYPLGNEPLVPIGYEAVTLCKNSNNTAVTKTLPVTALNPHVSYCLIYIATAGISTAYGVSLVFCFRRNTRLDEHDSSRGEKEFLSSDSPSHLRILPIFLFTTMFLLYLFVPSLRREGCGISPCFYSHITRYSYQHSHAHSSPD